MTKFAQDNNTYRPLPNEAIRPIEDRLPAGTYTIGQDLAGWFIQRIEDYKLGKIYGDIEGKAKRIIQTFNSRPAGTGLLLSGEKGCGKTMLAKLLSLTMMQDDVPTIVINQAWSGESFNKLIQSIDQPCVIIFDEFEKIYHDKKDQNEMLTLLDGVYPSKKLFILTTNDRYGISEHMRNRPGRLFYHLEYKGLDELFVRDYCNDCLNNKDNMQGVVNLVELFEHFNFDMLKAIVEEMNRYNETALEAMKMMNIRIEAWTQRFSVRLFKGEKELDVYESMSGNFFHDPSEGFNVAYHPNGKPVGPEPRNGAPADLKEWHNRQRTNNVQFDEDTLMSAKKGVYTYKTGDFTCVLTKVKHNQLDYSTLALAA